MTSNADPCLVRVARMRWNASLFTASSAVPCRGMLNRGLLIRAKSGALFRDVATRGHYNLRPANAQSQASDRVPASSVGRAPWQLAQFSERLPRPCAMNRATPGQVSTATPRRGNQSSRRGRETRSAFAVRQSSRTSATVCEVTRPGNGHSSNRGEPMPKSRRNRAAFDSCEFRDGASRAESATICSPRESNKPRCRGARGPGDSSKGDMHSVFGRHS
jgi:hypothetical protein